MEKMNSVSNERVCDLMDGQIQGDASYQDTDALLSDQEAKKIWHAYHVVGDVLRSSELAPSSNGLAFLERLESRLALEPSRPVANNSAPLVPVQLDASTAANASIFRWKMLAGLAGFALVGVVTMNLLTPTGADGEAQLAVQNVGVTPTSTTLVAAKTGVGTMLRDACLDELMAAHRQLGGHSALQVPAAFVRNATYEGPDR